MSTQGQWITGVREGTADLGDVQLHYVEAGEGPLVVLLHGFPECWCGWRAQIQPLTGLRPSPTSGAARVGVGWLGSGRGSHG